MTVVREPVPQGPLRTPFYPRVQEIDIVNQKTNRRIRRAFVLLQLTDPAYLKVPGAVSVTRPVQVGNQ